MARPKMHVDEVDTDVELVRRLLRSQHPQWADLVIEPVDSDGTENAIYRIGDDICARLPRYPSAATVVDKEQTWAPRLAPHLPLPIPLPVARGEPGEGYPFRWSVFTWIDGERATPARIDDQCQLATDLAAFITALQGIDANGAPMPAGRGEPLATRDARVRSAIAELDDLIDVSAVTAAWESALDAPVWWRPPRWIHGDLSAGNMLARGGRLVAVIDFGGLCAGDPACDLQIAWNLLPADAREVLRRALAADDAMWERGRGWALSVALLYAPYYRVTNPEGSAGAIRLIERIVVG